MNEYILDTDIFTVTSVHIHWGYVIGVAFSANSQCRCLEYLSCRGFVQILASNQSRHILAKASWSLKGYRNTPISQPNPGQELRVTHNPRMPILRAFCRSCIQCSVDLYDSCLTSHVLMPSRNAESTFFSKYHS